MMLCLGITVKLSDGWVWQRIGCGRWSTKIRLSRVTLLVGARFKIFFIGYAVVQQASISQSAPVNPVIAL